MLVNKIYILGTFHKIQKIQVMGPVINKDDLSKSKESVIYENKIFFSGSAKYLTIHPMVKFNPGRSF